MDYYLKCEVCGNYDEIPSKTIRLHGIFGVPSVCHDCIEEEKMRRLNYDADECSYNSVDEYLFGENYNSYSKDYDK